MGILKAIVQFFFGTDSDSVMSKVAGGISAVTLVAAIAPFAIWLVQNKDDTFVEFTFSYGETAFIMFMFWILLEFFRTVKDTS